MEEACAIRPQQKERERRDQQWQPNQSRTFDKEDVKAQNVHDDWSERQQT